MKVRDLLRERRQHRAVVGARHLRVIQPLTDIVEELMELIPGFWEHVGLDDGRFWLTLGSTKWSFVAKDSGSIEVSLSDTPGERMHVEQAIQALLDIVLDQYEDAVWDKELTDAG